MNVKRHLIQLFAALLYSLDVRSIATLSVSRASTKGVCTPGLHCYSCPGAIGACPVGAIQQALASSSLSFSFYVVGTILAFGALLGRTVCGWLCPFGFLQDLLDKAGRAVRLPVVSKGAWSRRLSRLKYVVLSLVVIGPLATLVLNGIGSPLFCSYLCPSGTVAGIALVAGSESLRAAVGTLFSWKVGVLGAIVVAALFLYRPFCRFLCPLGAFYGFFNRFCLLRYSVDAHLCTKCGACVRACRMDVKRVGDGECIQCGECRTACEYGAVRFSVQPKRPFRHRETKRNGAPCAKQIPPAPLRQKERIDR